MFRLTKNLDEIKKNPKIWNRKMFKNVHYRKAKLKERLEEIGQEIMRIGRIVDLDNEERYIF